MKKTLILIACSTMLLAACSSKKAEDTKPVVEQKTASPEVNETTENTTTANGDDLVGTINPTGTEDSTDTTNPTDANKAQEAPVTDGNSDSKKDDNISSNDITGQVVEFIMNGQDDKPAADQLNWSKTFLDKVNLNDQYQKYLSDGGVEGDIEKFAAYITENAPIADDWQDMFKVDLKATYGMDVTKLEDLGDNQYQAYVMNEDTEVPYVVVNARTGYFHG